MRPVRNCTSVEPPRGCGRWELQIVHEMRWRNDGEIADALGRTRAAVRAMRRALEGRWAA